MKLPRHAFETYWDVHAWSGALCAIVLHTIFFTGAFVLFHDELAIWQEVRAHGRVDARCEASSIDALVAGALASVGGSVTRVWITLPEHSCAPHAFELRRADERLRFIGDPTRVQVHRETSVLATFLFYLHFLYHPDVLDGGGIYVAGALGVALLLAIVSGLLIHLKDFARQLHRVRDGRGARVLFSDVHKVVGVMGLPFQTIMALTGAIICFAAPLGRVWEDIVFDGDAAAVSRTFYGIDPPIDDVGAPGSSMPLATLIARARHAVPGMQPDDVRIDHPRDAASSIEVSGRVPRVAFGIARVRLRAADGVVLHFERPERVPAPQRLIRWVHGLHFAWTLGGAGRVIYALLALAGCATLLTGNWIWLERRDRARRSLGHRMLARATLGGGLGIALAVAAMFVANRIAAHASAWRPHAEIAGFLGGWALAIALAVGVRSEARSAASILALAGASFAIAALLGIAITPLHLGTPGPGDVDRGLLVLGVGLLGAAAIVVRRVAVSRDANRE